jgi:hypothetical protein
VALSEVDCFSAVIVGNGFFRWAPPPRFTRFKIVNLNSNVLPSVFIELDPLPHLAALLLTRSTAFV